MGTNVLLILSRYRNEPEAFLAEKSRQVFNFGPQRRKYFYSTYGVS